MLGACTASDKNLGIGKAGYEATDDYVMDISKKWCIQGMVHSRNGASKE